MISSLPDIPDHLVAELRRHNLLYPLVRSNLISHSVSEVELTPDQKAQALKQHESRMGFSDLEQQKQYLSQNGLSLEDWLWQAELPLRIRLYSRKKFKTKAESRFLETKHVRDQVIYSILRVDKRFVAQELYLRISGGEADFPELARAFLEAQQRKSRPTIGPVPLARTHPVLAERLRQASPGVVLEPFQIDNHWAVVRLNKLIPAVLDEATIESICKELFDESISRAAAVNIEKLVRRGAGKHSS